jgi:hypothetical protein
MKKWTFMIGIGIGFILGSKAGSGPWDRLEEKVRSLKQRPEVEEAVDRVKGAASQQVTEVARTVNEKLPPTSKEVVV